MYIDFSTAGFSSSSTAIAFPTNDVVKLFK